MSNKTQLQTNNTALDGYIARINAAKDVAAGLPEAGGGGSGGGSVETCTVTITPDVIPSLETPTYYYTDATTMTIQSLTTQNATITVPKHSIIAISGWSPNSLGTGSCNKLFYAYLVAAYSVTGDCTFIYYT